MTHSITIWVVYTNDDLTEGRGREFVKHFCKTEATATRLAKNGYVQGADCPVFPVEAQVVGGRAFLPISIISIIPPSAEDEATQRRIDGHKLAMEKARSLGLSDDDIAVLVKGGNA